jgi:serine/threonine-protein kinase
MATVYVGADLRSEGAPGAPRIVAIKVIKPKYSSTREFVDMFVDEAKIASRLRHPNIIELHELGVEGERAYIVMELLRGESLWRLWDACSERRVRLRYDMVAWMGARIADGLHYAHELRDEATGQPMQIVHRDVNGSNIFVTYDGAIKLIDFGLATARDRISRTAAGVIKGKLAYMSPEQAVGERVDRRADVFGLAATLWELTTDRRLFKGVDDMDTLRRVREARLPDPTELVEGYPEPLWRVLRRALSRDRDARHATAAELARDLDLFAASEGRSVNEAAVRDVMKELFSAEKERQERWVIDASDADKPAPAGPLKEPSELHVAKRDALEALPSPREPSPFWTETASHRSTFAPAPRPRSAAPPPMSAASGSGHAGEETRATTPSARAASRARRRQPVLLAVAILVVVGLLVAAALALGR